MKNCFVSFSFLFQFSFDRSRKKLQQRERFQLCQFAFDMRIFSAADFMFFFCGQRNEVERIYEK